MHKRRKILLFFLVLFIVCGCGKTEKKENGMEESVQNQEDTQNQETENNFSGTKYPSTQEIARDAYFLDRKTIFSATVPENWYSGFKYWGDSSKAEILFRCITSEEEGFFQLNFFEINVEKIPETRKYKEYKKNEFRFMDGKKGKRYIWEYDDEIIEELSYHADVLVLPGEDFQVRSSEAREMSLTVGRYEKNKDQIEAFYNSILYQEQAEQIGRNLDGELKERERIRVHLRNPSINVELVVPEGIFYETKTEHCESGGRIADEFCLRLYLDDEKKNYVDICSDLCGIISESIYIERGYRAEFLDSGELVYCLEWGSEKQLGRDWKGDEFRQCSYTFAHMNGVGAKICVEKEKPELYELAQEIVRSVRLNKGF